jgi:hypothetical protein
VYVALAGIVGCHRWLRHHEGHATRERGPSVTADHRGCSPDGAAARWAGGVDMAVALEVPAEELTLGVEPPWRIGPPDRLVSLASPHPLPGVFTPPKMGLRARPGTRLAARELGRPPGGIG